MVEERARNITGLEKHVLNTTETILGKKCSKIFLGGRTSEIVKKDITNVTEKVVTNEKYYRN